MQAGRSNYLMLPETLNPVNLVSLRLAAPIGLGGTARHIFPLLGVSPHPTPYAGLLPHFGNEGWPGFISKYTNHT